MRPPPSFARQRHQPARSQHRGFHIAPFLVIDMRHARREHGLARLQAIFIFRMVANGAAAGPHRRFQAFIIFHQQITRGGARKNLHRANIGFQFKCRKLRDIRLRAADINADIAPGMAVHEFALGIQPFGIDDGRRGIGHIEHGRQATKHGSAGAGFHGFHLGVARVAQMHMRVNQAGQHMQPLAINRLRCFCLGKITNGGDAPGANADISAHHPPRHHTVSALQG